MKLYEITFADNEIFFLKAANTEKALEKCWEYKKVVPIKIENITATSDPKALNKEPK
jgi:hypothetical protein